MAFRLGREGRRVLVLERDLQQPDRIVGELLQPGGYLKLKELGLAQCVEGIDAVKVNGYAIFKGEEVAVTKYPVAQGSDVAGRSFHHGRFVQQLRVAAGGVEGVSAARVGSPSNHPQAPPPRPPGPRDARGCPGWWCPAPEAVGQFSVGDAFGEGRLAGRVRRRRWLGARAGSLRIEG